MLAQYSVSAIQANLQSLKTTMYYGTFEHYGVVVLIIVYFLFKFSTLSIIY